jgi:hypothetical protein
MRTNTMAALATRNGIKRKRVVVVEDENRPIRSLTAEELFAASLPRVTPPVEYDKLERFYRREHGLTMMLDSTTYDYYLPRYTREMPRRQS